MAITKIKNNGFGGEATHHVIHNISLSKKTSGISIQISNYNDAQSFNDGLPAYPSVGEEGSLFGPFVDLPASVMTPAIALQDAIQEYLITLPLFNGGTIVNDDGTPIV